MSTIYFYSPNELYGELSNFYLLKTPIEYKGKTYSTSEHLYQALKYMYEGASDASLEHAEIIRTTSTPYKAKYLTYYDPHPQWPWQKNLMEIFLENTKKGACQRESWDMDKLDVMQMVLMLKFTSDKHSQNVLLSTGSSNLAELSPSDSYWGVGRDGKGSNHLGKLLVQVREKIKNDLLTL